MSNALPIVDHPQRFTCVNSLSSYLPSIEVIEADCELIYRIYKTGTLFGTVSLLLNEPGQLREIEFEFSRKFGSTRGPQDVSRCTIWHTN
ncbi:MAG: hypothetical protein ABSG62_15320, partial [Terracidiphilus sp.]